MSYIFKGNLIGMLCPECPEPLSDMVVRLYRVRDTQNIAALAVANPKDTFAFLTDKDVAAKASSLIAEIKTDANGNFLFELGTKQKYSGEPFEIDVYCTTVPRRVQSQKPPTPLQFSITTLQPLWRETPNGLVAAWEYVIASRFWCLVRARFGAWTICGKMVTCDDKKIPLPGIKVTAFDVDLTQDDLLGSDVTDFNGKFRIDYLTETFQKTPFSFINLELIGGPDVYFKATTAGGVVILNEDRLRGRQPDRENRGNCFCVELCVKEIPESVDVPPSFTHVGQYKISTQISAATGLTVADSRAFFSTLRLYGTIPKKIGGQPAEYMFDIAEYDPTTDILGAVSQIQPTQIARTVIGQKMTLTGDPVNPIQVDDWTVNGGAGELIAPFSADGWVQVPQDADFYPNTGALPGLVMLKSQTLAAWGTKDISGKHAGSSTMPPALAIDRRFRIRMWVRSSSTPAQLAGTCTRLAVDNTLYDNVTKGGSWAPHVVSSQLDVTMVDITELVGSPCGGIAGALHVLYTAAHPNLGTVSLSMSGPGGPYGFTMTDNVGSTPQNRFGSAELNWPGHTVADLTPCAYIVTMSTQVLLTTGDHIPDLIYDQIGFCKKP